MKTKIIKMKRTGKKWNVNEILSLQREYELLQMSIDDIATKHKRTPTAIMYKLHEEGFARFDWLFSSGPKVVKQDVLPQESETGIVSHCPSLGMRPNVLFESGVPSFNQFIVSLIFGWFIKILDSIRFFHSGTPTQRGR